MNNFFKTCLLFAGITVMSNSSCDKDSLGSVKTSGFNSPFELALNGNMILSKEKKELIVKLNKITDSRCPPNLQCIWAGNVTTEVKLTAEDGSEAFAKLCLGECDKAFKTSDTSVISLNNTSYIVILSEVRNSRTNKAVLLVKKK